MSFLSTTAKRSPRSTRKSGFFVARPKLEDYRAFASGVLVVVNVEITAE
jgi:hypothetical protein